MKKIMLLIALGVLSCTPYDIPIIGLDEALKRIPRGEHPRKGYCEDKCKDSDDKYNCEKECMK